MELAKFEDVFSRELDHVAERRHHQLDTSGPEFELPDFSRHLIPSEDQSDALRSVLQEMTDETQEQAWQQALPKCQPGLVGLALSGGGIRSATFNLGILQVLEKVGLFKCMDYISTVSGGGYLGTYISTYFSNKERISGGAVEQFPFRHIPGQFESAEMRHLRNNSNYLAPEGFRDALAIPIVLGRGIVVNLAVILPYLLLTAVAISYFLGEKHPPYAYSGIWDTGFGPLPATFPLTTLLLILIGLTFFLYPLYQWWIQREHSEIEYNKAKRRKYLKYATWLWIITAITAFAELQPVVLTVLAEPREELLGGTALLAIISNLYSNKIMDHLSTILGKVILSLVGLLSFAVVWLIMLHLVLLVIEPPEGMAKTLIPGISWPGSYLVIAVCVFTYTWLLVDINYTGIHKFYRDRLSTAFVDRYSRDQNETAADSASQKTSPPSWQGADESPALEDLETRYSPYHLLNAAVNVDQVDADNAFRNGRHSSCFMFSKAYCGGSRTGYFPTDKWREKTGKSVDIATAMAISGAAVAPNMGKLTNPLLTFILALLNLRLNFWMANPRILAEGKYPHALRKFKELGKRYEKAANRAGPRYLFREMLGKLKADNRFVNLSDGGHIENLGIYELVRRQCRLIVAGDGEADSGLSFNGLAEVVRMVRIDFGYNIEMDGLDEIRAGSQQFAVGRIHYDNGRVGFLIYLKLNLGGDYNLQATLSEGNYRTSSDRDDDSMFDDNPYIADYRKRHPSFPHQSTADQFFDETQFECYRALGHQVASAALLK